MTFFWFNCFIALHCILLSLFNRQLYHGGREISLWIWRQRFGPLRLLFHEESGWEGIALAGGGLVPSSVPLGFAWQVNLALALQ